VLQLHKVLCRGFWPDLTILMDSEVAHSVKRARRRNKVATDGSQPDENRFEQESTAFFTRVQQAFRAIAQREPQRVAMVDARRPSEVVHPEIVRIVRKRLLGGEAEHGRRIHAEGVHNSDAVR
jgi:dTMP kinase